MVDQQIDSPLVEAPLDGMVPDATVGQGEFVPVEMKGKGTARLYELPDGTRIVRFEDDFEVSTNTDLFVWLSEAEAPATEAPVTEAQPPEATELQPAPEAAAEPAEPTTESTPQEDES